MAANLEIPCYNEDHYCQVFATYTCRHEEKQVFVTDAYERYAVQDYLALFIVRPTCFIS